jgi:hypothetical protein
LNSLSRGDYGLLVASWTSRPGGCRRSDEGKPARRRIGHRPDRL